MTIAVDASTPAATTGSGVIALGGSVVSNAITAPANSLIVVCFCCGGITNAGVNPDVMGSSVTGGGLTFTERAFAYSGSSVYSSIWTAYGSPAASSSLTFTFGAANGSNSQGYTLIPIVLTGCASVQNGAVATDQAGSTGAGIGTGGAALEGAGKTPSVVVNATSAGSLVIAAEANFTSATAPTASGDQTVSFNGHSSFFGVDGNGFWAQMEPTLTTGSGNVTISDSAPTGLTIAMCAVEILSGSPTILTSTFSVSDPAGTRTPGIH